MEEDLNYIDNNIDKELDMSSTKENPEITTLCQNIHIPQVIKDIYTFLDSPDRKFRYNIFTFLSMREIVTKYNSNLHSKLPNKLNNKIIDIASSYYGLGYIIVLSWNSAINAYILRRDGGSNDCDRYENLKFILNYDPYSTQKEKMIPEDKIFNRIAKYNLEDLRELFINN